MFKFLINDEIWSAGDNHTVAARRHVYFIADFLMVSGLTQAARSGGLDTGAGT